MLYVCVSVFLQTSIGASSTQPQPNRLLSVFFCSSLLIWTVRVLISAPACSTISRVQVMGINRVFAQSISPTLQTPEEGMLHPMECFTPWSMFQHNDPVVLSIASSSSGLGGYLTTVNATVQAAKPCEYSEHRTVRFSSSHKAKLNTV